MLLQRIGVSAILVMTIHPQPMAAQPTRGPGALDPETEAAWAKIGATATWFGQGADQQYSRAYSPEGLTDAMVYFWYPNPQGEIRWDKLPDPKVPFGIELGRSQTTDATIEQLKGFKTLAAVDLSGTDVTDKGFEALTEFKGIIHIEHNLQQVSVSALKHLKKFPALRSLSFGGPKVTDEVLKEVAGVEGLTALDLHYSVVTDEGL